MMEIRVKIECAEIAAAMERLAAALNSRKTHLETTVKADTKAECQDANDAPKAISETAPESPTVVEISAVSQGPAPGEKAEHVEENTQRETSEPVYTLQALSIAGAGLLDKGMLPDLMKLLGDFNVHAITQLKPEQYPAMAEGLRKLGASI